MKPVYNAQNVTPRARATLASPVIWAARELDEGGNPIRFSAGLANGCFLPKRIRKAVHKRLAHLKSEADVAAFNRLRND